jgi:hypothetical protein
MKIKTPRPFHLSTDGVGLGSRLREARLRRDISTVLFFSTTGRATPNRMVLDASIAIGTYLRALRVLGMDNKDLDAVANNDELGRKLQDAKSLVRTPRASVEKPCVLGRRTTQRKARR